MVQCLHKLNDDRSGLAVGKTFRFSSGDAYTVQASGAVVSANPKTYRGKAGRKQMLRRRRALRSQTAAVGGHSQSPIANRQPTAPERQRGESPIANGEAQP
jgi:hypothetical protein